MDGRPSAGAAPGALEVLGEDSDARKKRFEATLPNNRYLQLKPLREEQRLKAIKAGTIPDPSKPMRLDQATDFQGTCVDMCPEWEREEREYQNNVDPLERYPGTTRIDPARAVKAFHRPAAGNDQPLPSDVRPAPVLHRTLDYLFHDLLPTQPLAATHPFLRDRTRSIRQDFTVQNLRDINAIQCNERIARYHILAIGVLREETGFSEQQELEQLRKVLKSLNEFYDDLRLSGEAHPSPNEAEFRAYNLLTHLRDPDIIWSIELLPPHILSHPLLQRALALHRLAQKANIPRGERATQNAFSRFFKLVGDPGTPYLFACILSTHFNDVRRGAIEALRSAFLKQHSAFPLRTLAKVLGCDDEADARAVCEQLGIVVRSDERGRDVAELHKQAALKAATLRPKVARRLVEGKRGGTSYQAVIDGALHSSERVEAIPTTPSAPTPAFAAAAPAQRATSAPFSAPAFPRPSPAESFGNTGTSQISTPVVTPPRIATPAPVKAFTNLDASAPSFVPFGQPKPLPAGQAPPSAPLPTFPSFNPAASPFMPVASRPAPAAQPSSAFQPVPPARQEAKQPSPIPDTADRLPTAPAAPLKVSQPLVTDPAATTPSPIGARKVVPSPPAPARPSAAALAAAARRTQLVQDLVHHFAGSIIQHTVEGPIHRAASLALKERWSAVRAEEARRKRALVEAVAQQTTFELGRLSVRVGIFRGVRDERSRRSAWQEWQRAVQRSLERKARDAELRSGWRNVVGAIVAGSHRYRGDDARDKAVEEEPADDDVIAGSFDLPGLSFGDLSLVASTAEDGPDKSDRADVEFAGRFLDAADERERIWTRGTFLDIVADAASRALAEEDLAHRPEWTALIATQSTQSPFATWLTCKFDLDPSKLSVEIDTPKADISVKMHADATQPHTQDLAKLGLLVFVYSSIGSKAQEQRKRLHRLVAAARAVSLYSPSLLVLDCTETSGNESSAARDVLGIDALEGLAATRVYRPQLLDAEASFAENVEALLGAVRVLRGRILIPVRDSVDLLSAAWRATLTRLYRRVRIERPIAFMEVCMSLLQKMADGMARLAPAQKRGLRVPVFPGDSKTFADAVHAFILDATFSSTASFPAMMTLLAARPVPADHLLARALVDSVADFVFTALSGRSVRQEALEQDMPVILREFKSSLGRLEERFGTSAALPTPPSKKRRASAVPDVEGLTSSPKKQANGITGMSPPAKAAATGAKPQDRLSALEGLMRDARALIAR